MESPAKNPTTRLADDVRRAIDARAELLPRLLAEGTDSWRIFHGIAEGRPGLTVDRYGALVLVQTFREPLERADLDAIEAAVGAPVVWNHRGKGARESFEAWHAAGEAGEREHVARELGVAYAIRARHRGQDPWLFLDLRAGRRALTAMCAGKSVLNLFAYTGAAGIAALVHGASEAWNVDFARSSLSVSKRHAELNAVDRKRLVTVEEDVFPVVWQLTGVLVKGRLAARPYVRVQERRFDVVFLDPPALAKSRFGSVDVERDYAGLFKPAVLALEDGGAVIATNHVASVAADAWREGLLRCAAKAGRPLADVELIEPDDDFPSFDGRKPQKIAVCRL
jgi:23S rRNA (cytosine1962-C5)-methyltransferase